MLQKFLFGSKKGFKMIKFISVLMLTLATSCNGNVYTDMSNKTTEQALLENAVKAINKGDYDGAIAYLAQITSAFRHDAKVSKTAAAAYAGKCGLDFFTARLSGVLSCSQLPEEFNQRFLSALINFFTSWRVVLLLFSTASVTFSGPNDPSASLLLRPARCCYLVSSLSGPVFVTQTTTFAQNL